MTLKSDNDSRTIISKLLIFIPSFYVTYYVIGAILVGALDAGWKHLAKLPFHWKSRLFNPTRNHVGLASFLSMVLAYLGAVLLLFLVVKSTRKSWDYAITLSLVHWALTCAIARGFPVNWVWWVTMLCCTAGLCVLGELSNYYLRDLRDIQLDH